MATHLTPDELHELWAELRLELRRLGGRPPLFQDEVDDESAELHAATAAGERAGPGAPSEWQPDIAPPRLAARDGRVPERLLRILDALSRMRSGTYGTCIACRRPIPFARLSAIPEATACIDCSGGSRLARNREAS
jgi:RNA polymerase-binding transcription factor DksA